MGDGVLIMQSLRNNEKHDIVIKTLKIIVKRLKSSICL